jgi:iduronate 2-sulfatase
MKTSYTRRRFIKDSALLAGAGMSFPMLRTQAAGPDAFGGATHATRKKPNVLFIAVDDMNNDMGCCGHPLVKTPNLDRLASQGTLFARNYNQYPLCSPSRCSLLTGLRPDTTRVFDLKYHFRQGLPDVVTLPQLFIQNGYYVARVGKIYHYNNPDDIGTNGLDDRASWMERFNPVGLDKTVLEPKIINYTPWRPDFGWAMAHLAADVPDQEHTDGMVATQTIKLIEAHKNEPFFIAAGFYRPHCPWVAPKKYFDLYPMDKIKLPKISPSVKSEYPEPALSSTQPWPYLGVSADQARECKRAYYATISFVDAQIGRLLNTLDRLGLRENTMIVFWSDHGTQLGEHGLWFKRVCFEESARTPLIVSVPQQKTAGQVCQRIVEHLDVYSTLAELAGLTPPAELQGRSLVPLLNNPAKAWPHAAFSQVQRDKISGCSVRTDRWRYTEWNLGTEGLELYDHDADPHELKNLAKDSNYADVCARLKEQLKICHPVVVQGGVAEPDTQAKFCD